MLIIEGKTGKSLKLQEIINNYKGNILMIDTVGMHHVLGDNDNLSILPTSLEKLWDGTIVNDYLDVIRKFDMIIFETNDKKEMMFKYKQLEKLIGKECIVTIQNNEIEDIKVYKI